MTVDNQPRQQAKLPISLCLKINEFLAPDQWPRFLHRVPEGGPVTYQLFGGEGAAEFLAPYTPEDVCVGGTEDLDAAETEQQLVQIAEEEASSKPSVQATASNIETRDKRGQDHIAEHEKSKPAISQAPIAQETQQIQTDNDAAIAAQLQQDEENGTASTPNASCQSSLMQDAGSRTDGQMKELLKGLQMPHIVRKSRTHGQHNCLIDSILLALQDKQYINPLEVDERAAVCSSIRRHLIDHHGVEPPAPDGRHSYLSHEDSFDAICNQLRGEHPNIWLDDVDVTRLSIVAVVFDRFQRRQLYDESGTWSAELEDVNEPVVSTPLNATGELTEVCIQLYCNTLADDHGTPYHYEWISVEAGRSEEEDAA